MILVLDTDGAKLKKKGKRFVICSGSESREAPAGKVSQILIIGASMISSPAMRLAVDNDIDVVFLQRGGRPYARLWNCRFGSTAAVRRAQFAAESNGLGAGFVKQLITEKLRNQSEYLQEISRRRCERVAARLMKNALAIDKLAERVDGLEGDLAHVRKTIFGIEGTAGRRYFASIGRLPPAAFRFKKRTRRPARDPFNSMLNYAYGMLYGMVEARCITAGLDPAGGYLHVDAHGRPSLVCDIIEPFRIHAEKCVMSLFSQSLVEQDMFEWKGRECRLDAPGRECVISAFRTWMESAEIYGHKRMARLDIIMARCREMAAVLLESGGNSP